MNERTVTDAGRPAGEERDESLVLVGDELAHRLAGGRMGSGVQCASM